ncbi:TonB C-terminal domain-containing protein [Helicobacter burdigaliensis]|uniref:TonB C-terminal domain-containing protein n=1 Tax=Helicobacter burdigaliensis TaxID=2315334 RepID=UPI000EF6BC54|nr:TonB C-terminal domain-containing protein [Helicobacter burdigaliensis]
MPKNILFFLSGLSAFLSYGLIVTFLYSQFLQAQKKPKAYTNFQEITFNISLLEVKNENKNASKPKTQDKKIEKIPLAKESASRSPNVGLGINKLFSQVDTKQPLKEEVKKEQSINDVVAKKKKAPKTTQKDTLKNDLEQIMSDLQMQKTMSFNTPKGEYNEFYAKVQEILANNWNPVNLKGSYEALVIVQISNLGQFTYEIKKYSNNEEFDRVLKEFLDIMLNTQFPRYEGGNFTNIEVTFKTKE